MEKDRQTKTIAILALFIGVATLTLGFATFSTRLVIQPKVTVKPDASSFRVVLSKDQDKETEGTITPLGNGEEVSINNDDIPTISHLKANFTKPGEKVVYEFYAVNVGEYDAYLNKIKYENIDSQTINKICTAGEGTTDEYVQRACESIRITIEVGEDDKACQTSTYGAHKLEKKMGEKVVVTIEYNKDAVRADGPFSVAFGDILLNYSTTDSETKNVPICDEFITNIASKLDINGRTNIEDNDNDGKISTSDKVTLGTESFYVVSTDEASETVTMLAEWNLNVGSNPASGEARIQNPACKGWVSSGGTYYCTILFSSTNYWSSSASTYPAWVYDNQSNLYTHVNAYVDKLKAAGYSSVSGRLIKHEELVALGCQPDGRGRECYDAPSWVSNTSFWSGSAEDKNNMWFVGTDGSFNRNSNSYANYSGVRPVIEINAAEI